MKYPYIILLSLAVMACSHSKTDTKSASADSGSYITSQTQKKALTPQEEEDFLVNKLNEEFKTRSFPTEEEMKMWELIDTNTNADCLPPLAKALIRLFYGNEYWGNEGNPELDCSSEHKILCPLIVDITGDHTWYAFWPDTVFASSVSHKEGKKYEPEDVTCGGFYKPWCSAEGETVGANMTFRFDVREKHIEGFSIHNGYCHTEAQWKSHGRIAKMQILVDNEPYKTVELEDNPFSQWIYYDTIPKKCRKQPLDITFKVLSIYPGTKYKDVSIGNVYFCTYDNPAS